MPSTEPNTIQLRLRELAQLFNSMDPSPFHDRDLDDDAEEFIIASVRELPDTELRLVIYLSAAPAADLAANAEMAVRNYFHHRAESKQRELRLLLRRGRTALLVGLVFLIGCFGAAHVAANVVTSSWSPLVKESLTIGGWVAMWRPLEVYLYDWWPIRADRRLLERLSRMRVELVLPDERRTGKQE